ncbi:branched-chain amino acid ABC transporter permease [Rhodopila sp.]|uniref:branched-chain amino acid ABC transporter permease n=1 Tax=Rhodopila sp. TaxID=2480087 RepID=UPI002C0FEAE1|nr:branched-chain amino acid ABC transporter permease [Rhodopila sp.]HVZ06283.1 branched-chain amino acid ABC transporter permease [Rhodopila sp.]
MPARLRWLLIAALIVAGWFLPVMLGGSTLIYNTLVVTAIFAVMAYGQDIILSDLGEVSLAHTAFFAAGAYATGILAVNFGWNAWATLAAAGLCAFLLALVVGLITLRTREFAFSLVTYATNVVVYTICYNTDLLGGSDGFVGIPPLDLSLPGLRLTALSNKDLWPYAYVLLLLVLYFVSRFRRSKLGHAALMVHMNTPLATMSGLDGQRVRLSVFLVSAPLTAVGGWLYAYQRAYVGPDLFETYFLVLMLTAVVLVGRRLLLGPLIGTALLMVQKSYLSLGAYFDKIVLGVVLVGVLCLFPGGLANLLQGVFGRRTRGRAAGGPVAMEAERG